MQFLNSEGYYVSAADFTGVHHTKVSCNLSAPNYKKNGIEIILFDLADFIIPCCHAFGSMLGLFLLTEKSLPASSQVLNDAGGGIWTTRKRHTRLGITAGTQFTSICPSLLQAKGWDEGCMQKIIRINSSSNSTMRNRLCRQHKHRDTLHNVHGD